MKRYWQRVQLWFPSVKDRDVRRMLRRIRQHGALTMRDIVDDVLVEKEHEWASRKPSKRALQIAFYKGLVTVSQRSGMLKTYELMNRHFGWKRLPRAASERDSREYLLDRALRSQGIVSLDSICHLNARFKPAMRRLIDRRARHGELVPVLLEGAEKHLALGPAGIPRKRSRASRGPRAHPFSVRSAHHSTQAPAAFLRLRTSLRGLRAQGQAGVRLLRLPRAGGGRDRRGARSEDGSRAAEAAGAQVDLDRQGSGAPAQAQRSKKRCTASSASSWRARRKHEPRGIP